MNYRHTLTRASLPPTVLGHAGVISHRLCGSNMRSGRQFRALNRAREPCESSPESSTAPPPYRLALRPITPQLKRTATAPTQTTPHSTPRHHTPLPSPTAHCFFIFYLLDSGLDSQGSRARFRARFGARFTGFPGSIRGRLEEETLTQGWIALCAPAHPCSPSQCRTANKKNARSACSQSASSNSWRCA